MYSTGLKTELRCRHILPCGPPGERIEHDHCYVVEVEVSGNQVDELGFLVDVNALREALMGILDRYRGCLMNELPEFACCSPSMENIAREVWERLEPTLGLGAVTLRIRVWEDPNAWASFEGSC